MLNKFSRKKEKEAVRKSLCVAPCILCVPLWYCSKKFLHRETRRIHKGTQREILQIRLFITFRTASFIKYIFSDL